MWGGSEMRPLQESKWRGFDFSGLPNFVTTPRTVSVPPRIRNADSPLVDSEKMDSQAPTARIVAKSIHRLKRISIVPFFFRRHWFSYEWQPKPYGTLVNGFGFLEGAETDDPSPYPLPQGEGKQRRSERRERKTAK